MDKLSIKGELLGAGWAKLSFSTNNENTLEMYPSFVFDGLSNLIYTVCFFNKGIDEVICGIFCEGDDYFVYIQNLDNQAISFKIFEYENYNGQQPTFDKIYTSKLAFETITTRKRLNHQVINLFYSFEQTYGLEGYKGKWFKDFPLNKYLELQKLQKNL